MAVANEVRLRVCNSHFGFGEMDMNELTIALQDGQPLYEQIYAFIKEAIIHGEIPFKTKLPSTRTLALHLQVSRSTVNLAYEQLMSEGYIESIAGSGYYVAEIEELLSIKKQSNNPNPLIHKKETKHYDYDFSPRGIDLSSFPYHTWKKISKEVLTDVEKELLAIGDPQGELELRYAIVNYLYSARGVRCEPEQMIIGAGNEYLLILLHQLLGISAKIAIETPTYKQAYRVLSSLGHQIKTIEMDSYGMRMDQLEESGCNAAYVMPSHQYPTGIVMSIKRRLELLAWTKQAPNRYIIEDDYDSEFRYKGKPIPALQGIGQNETVVYLGTFSRSIAPAIRISYMVLPKPLLKLYQERFSFYASTVSRIDQEIVTRFLSEGYYERHLNKMKALYRSKHDLLLTALKPFMKGFRISGEHAGMHLLLTAKKKLKEQKLIDLAEAYGVKVYGMSSNEIGEQKKEPATIILGYANITECEIEQGVQKLLEAWKEYL